MSADLSRIIVCDDNQDAAVTLAQVLRAYGYEVFSCFDGAACLEKARAWLPNAAILDIGLPGLTGYDLARALRALPDGVNMMLVAVTGYGQDADIKDARRAGFNWHFRKPPPLTSILEVLRNQPLAVADGTRLA